MPRNSSLDVTRAQILGFRRAVGALDERLPMGPHSLRVAAWAGLQDSMPRAALLSIHARVEATPPTVLDSPSLVQVWGPRFSVYVVAAVDHPIFTLGRYPTDDARGRELAEDMAARLRAVVGDQPRRYDDVGDALGVPPNRLRYATTTGTVLIRWEGARRPTIWTVPQPSIMATEARLELARRYVHVFGPTTAASFADWAGLSPADGRAAFAALATELIDVKTPIGAASALATDEAALRAGRQLSSGARLLPSGDTYFLLWGADRELLVPDAARRAQLWTSRVWPGALLIDGEVVGTWRRAGSSVTVETWRALTSSGQDIVQQEAASLPLPDVGGEVRVQFARAG